MRRRPRVLQMPVTSRCNSRCKTCNVWHDKSNVDIDPIRLKESLKSKYFSKVNSIGLNGGEITLIQDFDSIIDAICVLPNLKYVHIISNGLLPDRLLPILSRTKKTLNERGISLGFNLSLDGYGKVHENVRGVPNCFSRSIRILDALASGVDQYVDAFALGCTISKYNIEYIAELEAFVNTMQFDAYYHLAVPNKRIGTFTDADYSVLSDERAKNLAIEYFYAKWMTTSLKHKPLVKFRNFANYYYLKNDGRKRLASCMYKYRDITITEKLDIALCATASDIIGNLHDADITSIMRGAKLREVELNTMQQCETCIHYCDTPSIKGLVVFFAATLKERFKWGQKFKNKSL